MDAATCAVGCAESTIHANKRQGVARALSIIVQARVPRQLAGKAMPNAARRKASMRLAQCRHFKPRDLVAVHLVGTVGKPQRTCLRVEKREWNIE